MCDLKEVMTIINADFNFIKISWPNIFQVSLYTILMITKSEGLKLIYKNSLFKVTPVPQTGVKSFVSIKKKLTDWYKISYTSYKGKKLEIL